jgi:diguanylate cyclase (GGDEF)-like protein
MRALRTLTIVIVPEGLLVAGAVIVLRIPAARAVLGPIFDVLPWLVMLAGTLLSWRFRRLRIFVGLVAIALADQGMIYLHGDAVAGLLGSILPLVLLALAIGVGGFETWSGRIALLLVVIAVVVTLTLPQPIDSLPGFFQFPLLPADLQQRIGLPSLAIAAYGIAGLSMAGLVAVRRDRIVRGLLWGLVASVFGFAVALDRTSYFTVAGAVLIVALIEDAYALAYRDGLTGLPSRRAFDDALKRLRQPFVIAILDIDHFKKFNDKYGHDVGDQVLQLVARQLEIVGGGGHAFRYGGEEFAILFRGKKLDACEDHLERLRAAIGDAAFTLRAPDRPKKRPSTPTPRITKPQTLSVTASIGVAQTNEEIGTPQQVTDAADQALYRAKRAGRNRVTSERRKKWRR